MLDWLLGYGIEDIVVTTYTNAEKMEEFFDNNPQYDAHTRLVREEKLVSTVVSTQCGLEQARNETTLLMTADNMWEVDLNAFVERHNEAGAKATMLLTAREATANAGMVTFDPSTNRVTEAYPKNKNHTETLGGNIRVSTMGLYVVERGSMLAAINPDTQKSIERETMNELVPEVFGMLNEGFFYDIGTPEKLSWLQANPGVITDYFGSA